MDRWMPRASLLSTVWRSRYDAISASRTAISRSSSPRAAGARELALVLLDLRLELEEALLGGLPLGVLRGGGRRGEQHDEAHGQEDPPEHRAERSRAERSRAEQGGGSVSRGVGRRHGRG